MNSSKTSITKKESYRIEALNRIFSKEIYFEKIRKILKKVNKMLKNQYQSVIHIHVTKCVYVCNVYVDIWMDITI